MNKKYLVFGLMGVFAIGLVAAAIITQYGSVEQEISIESPITIDGETTEIIEGYSCGSYPGEKITINNTAPFDVEVEITNNAPDGITVDYVGTLTLSQKIPSGNETPWGLARHDVTIDYTVVGDKFNAEVRLPIEGYELIYYKDNSDRFNNPAKAIRIDDIEGNLPYEYDGNVDEYDMCEIEDYSNCHGAKIWYVPSDAILNDGNLDWSFMNNTYFETNLIQYENDVTIYDSLEITPVYNIDCHYNGTATITTTIA